MTSKPWVVGSGPWLFDSWTKGQQIVLVRNENYWGPKPALKKQIIRIVNNELANMQEFRAGNTDYLRRPSPEQWIQTVDASWFRERGAKALRYYTPRAGYQYLGYNLEDTALCPFTQPGDQQNADPLLGPLTDNGGPTLTHALGTGSPAMEAGTSFGLGVPGVDQRGVARPQDGDNDTFAIIDIGAYEHQFAVPNNPPTDISLVPSDADENVPVGTVVGNRRRVVNLGHASR